MNRCIAYLHRPISTLLSISLFFGSQYFLFRLAPKPALAEEDAVSTEYLLGDLVKETESSSLAAYEVALDGCIKYALERNYDLQKAKERIERQRHVKLEARGSFLPSLGVEGFITQTDEERLPALDGTVFGTDKSWTVDVFARYALYNGGKDVAEFRRQKLLEQSAQAEFQAVLNDVIQQVKERFYAVLLAKAQLEVQKEDTRLLEEQLRNEKSRFAAGTVSEFTVIRAEVAFANSRTPLVRARNDLRLAYEELRRVIGFGGEDILEPRQPFRLLGSLQYQPFSISLNEALSLAMEKRPELTQAQLTIDAEKQGIRVEQAEYLPKLSVFGGYGADKSAFEDDLDEKESGWKVGAQTQWNLFDGLRTNSRVSQARAGESLARISFEQTRQGVNVEVRRVYSSLIEAKELVSVSRKVVNQAEEGLRLARARQSAGAGTQLETLDSQVALTQARTNEIKALYDYNIAHAQMVRAVGGDEYALTGSRAPTQP